MYKLFSRLFVALLLTLPWLLCAGCNEQQETRLTTTVRQAEAPPPVEEPASELLLSQRAFHRGFRESNSDGCEHPRRAGA